MDYVIYTFGGGEALWKVFNGLALLFKSDSVYMTSVVKLSLAVGGLWAALRAILGANVGLFTRDYVVPTYLILNLLLLPKTSVHIVDEVNPDFQYSKVDHIPIGIAAIASTASKISKVLTDSLETALTSVEANHYGKTGAMFSARLVMMARELRIVDPVERQNMKDFVRQCFMLPFVWTNLLAGKKEALETDDILGLISDNAHQWLGSYWRIREGEPTFLYCKEGAAKARDILSLEVPAGLAGLAIDLLGGSDRRSGAVVAGTRLRKYFDNAWESLSSQTATAHKVASQEMMMNAYREAVDDKRQEFGLERLNPHLIAYSSARAKAQQNTGFLVSAQMVGSMLPSLQSTMLAILCVLFVVVIPMTMLSGGLKTLGMWVKLILWVESWPVFFAIIHCIAMVMASSRGAAYVKTGAGLSLLTQNGLADAAYDAYCYAEGFMSIVPVIAWAVISGGGYALANLSGTVTRSVDGLSSKIGSEIVDGNLSFDNQSFHNRSIAGYQLAQQQLGSSFSFGENYDDGRFKVTRDTQGKAIIQEQQTILGTNVSGSENLSASLTESGQRSLAASSQNSQMASESFNQGLNELYSYGSQYIKTHGMNQKFGTSQDVGEGRDWKNTLDTAHKFAQDNKISDDKAFQILAYGGANTGLLKTFGIDAGIRTQVSGNATDAILVDKARSSGLSEQFGRHLSSAFKHATGTDGSLSDQAQKNVLESLQGNFQKARMYQEQSQASYVESENYQKAAAIVESTGATITSNWNDPILKDVADQCFGGDVLAAGHWGAANRDAYDRHAAEFVAKKLQPFMQSLKTDHPLSAEQVKEKWQHYSANVPNTIESADIESVQKRGTKEGLGLHDRQKMEGDFEKLGAETHSVLKGMETRLDGHKGHIQKDYESQEVAFKTRKGDGVIVGGVKKVVYEGIQTAQDMAKGISPASFVSTYIEDDIEQTRTGHKIASQGREIRQLRESIDMAKTKPSEDEPFDITSSQTVDR